MAIEGGVFPWDTGGMYTVELYARVRRAVHVDGRSQREVAREFGLARKTVRKMWSIQCRPVISDRSRCGGRNWVHGKLRTVALWRGRFLELGLSGLLKDAARPGRKPSTPASVVAKVIEKTTQSRPANATHWSRSTMAREVGVSDSTVERIWKAHGSSPIASTASR